jgi:hypothetical protein
VREGGSSFSFITLFFPKSSWLTTIWYSTSFLVVSLRVAVRFHESDLSSFDLLSLTSLCMLAPNIYASDWALPSPEAATFITAVVVIIAEAVAFVEVNIGMSVVLVAAVVAFNAVFATSVAALFAVSFLNSGVAVPAVAVTALKAATLSGEGFFSAEALAVAADVEMGWMGVASLVGAIIYASGWAVAGPEAATFITAVLAIVVEAVAFVEVNIGMSVALVAAVIVFNAAFATSVAVLFAVFFLNSGVAVPAVAVTALKAATLSGEGFFSAGALAVAADVNLGWMGAARLVWVISFALSSRS